MALTDQAAGQPHGFANPALYAVRGTAFRDVAKPKGPAGVVRVDYDNGIDSSGGTTTTLRSLTQLQTLHLRGGYDDVTGIGSPRADVLVGALGG